MDQNSDITPTPDRPRSRKVKRRGRYTGSEGFKTDLAVLRAQGMSQRTTGRVLGVNQSTIARVEKLPEVQAKISDLGDRWKIVAQTRITEMVDSAMDMVEHAVETKDAKAFDASTRGLLALERISSSVANIPQRVDVTGVPAPQNPQAEIKALLAILFPEKLSPDDAPQSQPPR